MRLIMFNFEEFIKELRRHTITTPIAISFDERRRETHTAVRLIATAYVPKVNLIIEYEHFYKIISIVEIDEMVEKLNKERDELRKKIEEQGYSVVFGYYKQ